jgi:hypothetical protein
MGAVGDIPAIGSVSAAAFDPLRVLGGLVRGRVRFVLIGGFAAALRGSPMITGDLDICHAGDDANLERLSDCLVSLDARLRGAPADVGFRLDARTLAAGDHFTFVTSAGPLDCLRTPSGTDGFADLDASATDEDVDGVLVRVASLDDLIRMKRAAGRPQDRIAVEWLAALQDELDEGA